MSSESDADTEMRNEGAVLNPNGFFENLPIQLKKGKGRFLNLLPQTEKDRLIEQRLQN